MTPSNTHIYMPLRIGLVFIAFTFAANCATPAISAPSEAELGAEYRGWRVKTVDVDGLKPWMASDLKGGLVLAVGKHTQLYQAKLDADIDRILLFMARRGYPHAAVLPSIVANQEKRTLKLKFNVTPGPPVIIRTLEFDGVSGEQVHRVRHEDAVYESEVFVDEKIDLFAEAIKKVLERDGHAKAQVTPVISWIDSTNVTLHMLAVPGTVYYFNEIVVEGTDESLVPLAKTSINISQGKRYDPEKLEDARSRLRRLGLFGQVKLTTVQSGPDSLDVSAVLADRTYKTIELGGGYWTDIQFRGVVRWEHRNLFGRGRGGMIQLSYSKPEQDVDASVWWPTIIGPNTLAIFHVGVREENRDAFKMRAPNTSLTFVYRLADLSLASIGIEASNPVYDITTDDPDAFPERGNGRVVFLAGRASHNGSDDTIYPTRGTVSSVRVEWTPDDPISKTRYVLGEVSGAVYFPLYHRSVVALNLTAGFGKPLGASVDLLPNVRFYAGGSTDMRGFKSRQLGPTDSDNAPLGGQVKLTGSTEIRFPALWKFTGAVFLDAGQVWADRSSVSIGDIEFAIGPGLRLTTPIGPIRLDYGFRLTNHNPREPKSVFHFAIGQAF